MVNTTPRLPQGLWPSLSRHWLLIATMMGTVVALAGMWYPGAVVAYFRHHASPFEKFTLVLFLVLLLPPLFERLRLPGVVGLLLGGVLVGPYASAIVPFLRNLALQQQYLFVAIILEKRMIGI